MWLGKTTASGRGTAGETTSDGLPEKDVETRCTPVPGLHCRPAQTSTFAEDPADSAARITSVSLPYLYTRLNTLYNLYATTLNATQTPLCYAHLLRSGRCWSGSALQMPCWPLLQFASRHLVGLWRVGM